MSALYEHLVVLMMENRSFDHMLGFMKAPDYPIEGLNGDETNPDSTGRPVQVSRDADPTGDLNPDPHHDFRDVNLQIFGNEQGTSSGDLMEGFVRDYEGASRSTSQGQKIMRCWDPNNLPVLSKLARSYAVCDHWFSSVPGPTLPNRVFAHCATSRGRLDMSPDFMGGFKPIYQLLDDRDVSSTIYFHDFSAALSFEGLLFSQQQKFFSDFNDFSDDCKHDNLPSYSFIEPRYHDETSGNNQTFPQNDQHPDSDVLDGEDLIASVYQALTANFQVFKKTLLVIIYDEHGGLYDHVVPLPAEPPDGLVANPEGFRFDRLGVRVPAILVSPWINAGTIVKDVFDHTSCIAAARQMFTADAATNALSSRDRQAASAQPVRPGATVFGQIADFRNLATPRTDVVDFAVQPRTFSAAMHSPVRPLSDMQKDLLRHAVALNSKLSGSNGSNEMASRITTQGPAAAFMKNLKTRVLSRKAGVARPS